MKNLFEYLDSVSWKELFEDLRHVWLVALYAWKDRRHLRRGGNPDQLQF